MMTTCLYVLVTLWSEVTSTRWRTQPEVMSTKWRWWGGLDLNPEMMLVRNINTITELEDAALTLAVKVHSTGVTVQGQHRTIYEGSGSGVHILVLHSGSGHEVTRRWFVTQQPGEGHRLSEFLGALQPNRILVIAGVPEFITYLGPSGVEALKNLGALYLPRAAYGEPWALVVVTGARGVVLGESIGTLELGGGGVIDVGERQTNVMLHLQFPKSTVGWCRWEDRDNRELALQASVTSTLPKGISPSQARFCNQYDGYGDLCRCHQPFLPHSQPKPKRIPMLEVIPLVVVTANKPYHLYRLLKNLYRVCGFGETPILVVVDGAHRETMDLLTLFPTVRVMVHRPQGTPGHSTRTNSNIAFALTSVFSLWPHADKAILLEDDLILAPDLLRYFHYTAPLLDRDPSLYMVGAWGQHSYYSTAGDVGAIHRVEAYPQYGWMTSRSWAMHALALWVPNGVRSDWDWWMYGEGVRGGMEGVVPEVSRTAHQGAAGAHVTGWEQHMFMAQRLMTIQDHINFTTPLDRLTKSKYSDWLDSEIRGATKITLTGHPCNVYPIPANQSGPFVLYLGVSSRSDEYNSFYLMQACLGTDDQEVRELYRGVMRLRVRPYSNTRTMAARNTLINYTHNLLHTRTLEEAEEEEEAQEEKEEEEESKLLFLVGCPLSEYCRHSSGPSDWIIPREKVLNEAMDIATERRMVPAVPMYRLRVASSSPEEQFRLDNIRTINKSSKIKLP